jgi:hypothetical protein
LHFNHVSLKEYFILANDIPKVSGPIQADRYALARIMEINDMQHAIKKAR